TKHRNPSRKVMSSLAELDFLDDDVVLLNRHVLLLRPEAGGRDLGLVRACRQLERERAIGARLRLVVARIERDRRLADRRARRAVDDAAEHARLLHRGELDRSTLMSPFSSLSIVFVPGSFVSSATSICAVVSTMRVTSPWKCVW